MKRGHSQINISKQIHLAELWMHSSTLKTHTSLPVYHINLTGLLSHIRLPDTNPGPKIPFKSTVCRLCFTGGLCYCVITHKHSLAPSLTPSSTSLSPLSSAEPLIKSLRQKLLSSEYQVSAFRQEQHWQERAREREAQMTSKPAAVRGEEAAVPSDLGGHNCHCCSKEEEERREEKMAVV